jgi:hypothetical protein
MIIFVSSILSFLVGLPFLVQFSCSFISFVILSATFRVVRISVNPVSKVVSVFVFRVLVSHYSNRFSRGATTFPLLRAIMSMNSFVRSVSKSLGTVADIVKLVLL